MARAALLDESTPLWDVTFVVLDLETTGCTPTTCAITEVGAVKLRGGDCLGTFQTLVNPGPGVALPPRIVQITGITEAMLGPAPAIDSVLPAFVEFIGDAVIVGHNVRFDLRFLRADLERRGYPPLTNRFVDTCTLARRLVKDEVPDCKLATLADHFRTVADARHRAFDDASATGEVFHQLLERAGTFGVLALDDLLALPTTARHPQVAKLRWVASLPRTTGVFLFKDIAGRVLHVGSAPDLRRRVRSLFTSVDRRRIGPLLREAHALEHVACANELEASVRALRLIHEHSPRYNRQVKLARRACYVKLTARAKSRARLVVVRKPRPGDGDVYLGPLATAAQARDVIAAIETVRPLDALGTEGHADRVAEVARGLTVQPQLLLDALDAKMQELFACGQVEEARTLTRGAAALGRALHRQHAAEALVRAGRVELSLRGVGQVVLDHGRLVATWSEGDPPPDVPPPSPAPDLPLANHVADEVACVAGWLDARAGRVRLLSAEHDLAWPAVRLVR
jgi:DNA polymerase-3 subunit epsilon